MSIDLSPTTHQSASLQRRLASMLYEILLVIALLLVATFPFVGLTGGQISTGSKIALQIYLCLVCGAYFTWFWRRGGQTLPMKTWRIRVRTLQGGTPGAHTAIVRYVAALIGLIPLGLTLWWALIDRDRQFLHDRLAGTRLTHEP